MKSSSMAIEPRSSALTIIIFRFASSAALIRLTGSPAGFDSEEDGVTGSGPFAASSRIAAVPTDAERGDSPTVTELEPFGSGRLVEDSRVCGRAGAEPRE